MDALFSVAIVLLLIILAAHGVSVLLYARSDEWKIEQRLSRYTER